MELRHKAVVKLVREVVGRQRYVAYEQRVASLDYDKLKVIANDILSCLPVEEGVFNTLEELDAYVGRLVKTLPQVGEWRRGEVELTVLERDMLVSILIERLNQLHLFCEKSIYDKGLVELVKQGMEDDTSQTARSSK